MLSSQVALSTTANAANVACASTMTAQNSLKATPSQASTFYVDSGVTPKVDAAYVGYSIANSSGSTMSSLWVSIGTFTGGKVGLANPADQYQQLPSIAAASSKTAFFLLKAISATTTSQSHTIKIYDRRPDLSGATALLTCDYTFLKVKETIKAAANKVDSVSTVSSPSAPTLGGAVTVTVIGSTGKIGAGSTPDFDILWVSPAAKSDFPTRALRLESTTLTLTCTGSPSSITLTNLLYFKTPTATDCAGNASQTWTGVYTFRIIGPSSAATAIVPVAQISSGTQVKHSDINGLSGNTVNLSGIATSAFTTDKTASSTPASSSASSAVINYTITVTTSSATTVSIDEIVDTPASGVTFVGGSVRVTDATRTSATISDPTYIASEASLVPRPLHYVGPFTLNSTTPVTLNYQMNVPCSSVPTGYPNSAFSKVGDQKVGKTSTAIPVTTVTTTTSGASCTATVLNSNSQIEPATQTVAATSVTTATATVNGFASAYGASGVTALFRWGTSPSLTSGTATTPISVTGSAINTMSSSLTGLSPGTTYYFRTEIGSTYGDILSFSTLTNQAVPTAVTNAVSGLTASAATLNGTISPNLTDVTSVNFIYSSSSSTLASGTTTVTVNDGATPTPANITISGSGETGVPYSLTGLSTTTTYYYKVRANCTVNVTFCPAGFVDGAILSFTTGAPSVSTSAATVVGASTVTLNGSVNMNGTAGNSYFTYCAAGPSCSSSSMTGTDTSSVVRASGFNSTTSASVTGLTSRTVYYFKAVAVTSVTSSGEILSFTTLGISTSSLASGAVSTAYSAEVIGVGGSSSYIWSITAGSLPAGLTLNASTGVISGTPTTAGTSNFTVTITDNGFSTSTLKDLSIVITPITYTVTYDSQGGSAASAGSYSAGGSITLPTNPTRSGYTFNGWFVAASNGSALTSPYSPAGTGAITLYAQ
ncbi:MAG: InlB B-repeat-containing protein, partial [Actinobacteria bacterium]|nr:InlB B-repeat-containing protein [Actinomycetota bacterium]